MEQQQHGRERGMGGASIDVASFIELTGGKGPHLEFAHPSSLFCCPLPLPPLAALQVAAQALKLPLSKVFISETSTDKVRTTPCT